MKKTLILLILIISILSACGQNYDNRKYWSDEEITLDDFKGNPIEYSPFVSELQYFIGYEYKTDKVKDMKYSRFVTYTYIDRSISWIKSEGKNEITLLYNQTILNLAELYSRKLENKLNCLELVKGQENSLAHQYFSSIFDQCNKTINQFKGETSYGIKDSLVLRWHQKSIDDLRTTKRIDIPDYEEKNNSWGMDIGLGYGFLTGEISNYLNNHIDFLQYGFMYSHKKYSYDLRAILGAHTAKQSFDNNKYSLAADTGNLVAFIEASAGYQLYKNDRVSIYPFVGFGIFQLSRSDKSNDNETIEGPIKLQPNIGLNFDYKIKSASISSRQRTDLILKTRITYEPINYTGDLKGGTWNLTIGIGGVFQSIRFLEK